jgi:hypothetical protein
MTDFIYMVKNTGLMFITGPDVIKSVLGEIISGIRRRHDAQQQAVLHSSRRRRRLHRPKSRPCSLFPGQQRRSSYAETGDPNGLRIWMIISRQ